MPTEKGPEFDMTTPPTRNDWKATPLNIGIAIAIIAAAMTIISWSFKAQDFAEAVAAKVITAHSQSDIESAHTGIKRYVTKQEMQEYMIRERNEMRAEQRAATEEIKELIIRLDRRSR